MVWMWLWTDQAEAKRPRDDVGPQAAMCWMRTETKPRLFMGRTTLEYMTGKQLAAEEAKRAQAELREPMATPIHGMLTFKVERSTIGLANGDNQVFVVESGGAQVVREEPEADVPNTPGAGIYRYWWNTFVVFLPDDAAFPLTVHAADKTLAQRCSFSVSWDGVVQLL